MQEHDFLFTMMNGQHSHYTRRVLYIEAVTLALCSTTLPSPTVTAARVTVLDSFSVLDSSVSTHGHTRTARTSPVVAHNRRGIYTAEFFFYGNQMGKIKD